MATTSGNAKEIVQLKADNDSLKRKILMQDIKINGLLKRVSTLLDGEPENPSSTAIVIEEPVVKAPVTVTEPPVTEPTEDVDAVVVCLGINSLFEGEEGDAMMNPNGGDRMDIRLPENQLEYVKRIRDRVKNKPLIVVITGGSAIAIPEINELADAVLFAWYPGESGGFAIADIIFGDVNPSGRLPVTFYKSVNDLPDFENYNMEGRTYRYFEREPLFPFGFGLSYTDFEYSGLNLNQYDDKISLQVKIKNTGNYNGDEVVQIYTRKIDPQFWRPIKQLVGFKRVSLKQGEEKTISIDIDNKQLQYWDVEQQKYRIESGQYEFQVGTSSEDVKLLTSFEIK